MCEHLVTYEEILGQLFVWHTKITLILPAVWQFVQVKCCCRAHFFMHFNVSLYSTVDVPVLQNARRRWNKKALLIITELLYTEPVVQRRSVKKVFLKISQISQENSCARVHFLIKLQARGLQCYWKRDSGTSVFLWTLRDF